MSTGDQQHPPAPAEPRSAVAGPEPQAPATPDAHQPQPEQAPGTFGAGHPQGGGLLDPERKADDRPACTDDPAASGGYTTSHTPLP